MANKYIHTRHDGTKRTITTRLTSQEMAMIEYALMLAFGDDLKSWKKNKRKDLTDDYDVIRWKLSKKGLTNLAYNKFLDEYSQTDFNDDDE